MKKTLKNLLIVSTLSLGVMLSGCKKAVTTKPGNIDSNIVDFVDKDDDYFRNTIETIYNEMVNGGTTNTTIFDELINTIAKKEVAGFATEEKINELCHDIMLKEVKGNSSYNTNNLFDEEKYVLTLKTTNPNMNFGKGTYNKNYLISPEDEFEDVFKADYTEYIEKKVKPGVLKKLLTSKFLCKNSISSISRAGARDVQYIKLENFSNKVGEVNKLINEWLGEYFDKLGTADAFDLDLDELQAIYKGVTQDVTEDMEAKEKARAERINDYISRYYTLANEIKEDLEKIVEKDEDGNLVKDSKGNYVMLSKDDTDQTIEDKYTGSGAYQIEWGEELALRNLEQKDFTGDDIYTSGGGISDLPSEVTQRLFSASIASYIVSSDKGGVKFLTPKTILNDETLSKYYTYDSASNAYYIVVVNKYYTSSVVNKIITENTTGDKITYTDDLIDIAYNLADSATNQRQALVYYLQEYDVGSNIHDDDFYEYIVSNYSEAIK